MPGWRRSGGSGPLTLMLSNVTSTAWINQKEKHRKNDAAQTAERDKRRNELNNKLTIVYVDDQERPMLYRSAGL